MPLAAGLEFFGQVVLPSHGHETYASGHASGGGQYSHGGGGDVFEAMANALEAALEATAAVAADQEAHQEQERQQRRAQEEWERQQAQADPLEKKEILEACHPEMKAVLPKTESSQR